MRVLRASQIHVGEEVRVIAIESLRCDAGKAGSLYGVSARLEPAAMIVCTAGGHRLINLASVETSLEQLQRDVPGLRVLLAGTRA